MSYKDRLSDLKRDAKEPLGEQLARVFAEAIEAGELAPGDRLPPSRELAELAGVNHLTAVRAYRGLREDGLVTAQVGRGTFVRAAAPARGGEAAAGEAWQGYALPEPRETAAERALQEMFRHAGAPGLVPLSVGYPSQKLFPFEAIRKATEEALAERGRDALQYTDVAGLPELVEQIAALSAARGAPEDPERIVVVSGARQGLTLTARAVLRPGDVAACESPTFMGTLESLRATGARVVPVPVDGAGLDVDALEALLARQEIRLLAVQPRLHNPTGRDLAPARRERLLELARRHGFFLLEDGVYADLRFAGEDPGSLRAVAPEHVVYVDSLSKSVGGGLRIGWVAASGPVGDRIVAEKVGDDMHSATLTQLIVARFLAAGAYPSHIEAAREFHRVRCEALLATVEAELGEAVEASEPLGGGHVWLALEPGLDEAEVAAEAARHGVTVVPGAAMMPAPGPRAHLRLSFGYLDPAEIEEGVRRLARAIRALSRRPEPGRLMPIA